MTGDSDYSHSDPMGLATFQANGESLVRLAEERSSRRCARNGPMPIRWKSKRRWPSRCRRCSGTSCQRSAGADTEARSPTVPTRRAGSACPRSCRSGTSKRPEYRQPMGVYIVRRILSTILVNVCRRRVRVPAFYTSHQGIRRRSSPATTRARRISRQSASRLGLEDPILVQFGRWALRLLHGDLGISIFSDMPVMTLIMQRMQPTVSLTDDHPRLFPYRRRHRRRRRAGAPAAAWTAR